MPSAPSAGETWTRPADGMVMVYVPAGEFLMGATEADSEAGEDEKPPHRVYLDGFWIDRTEVTNAQYRKCVEARACREPWCWDESNFGYHDRFNALDQPVVCVLWNNAHDYAAWVGGRLPTEAEWDLVQRGPAHTDHSIWRAMRGSGQLTSMARTTTLTRQATIPRDRIQEGSG